MYVARLLPPDEWPRLAGTDLESVWPHLDPTTARIVVVERQGRIIGAVSVLRQVVLECLWVAPEWRARSTVGGHVLRLALQVAKHWGVRMAFTLPATDGLMAQAVRCGGVRIPRVVVLPVEWRGPRGT